MARQRFTDQMNTGASSAGGVHRDGTGAKRMTGVVTRDSASAPTDRQASGRMRVTFLPHRRSLVPHPADRLAAVPCPTALLHRPIWNLTAALVVGSDAQRGRQQHVAANLVSNIMFTPPFA